jgi:hypothetical protein
VSIPEFSQNELRGVLDVGYLGERPWVAVCGLVLCRVVDRRTANTSSNGTFLVVFPVFRGGFDKLIYGEALRSELHQRFVVVIVLSFGRDELKPRYGPVKGRTVPVDNKELFILAAAIPISRIRCTQNVQCRFQLG